MKKKLFLIFGLIIGGGIITILLLFFFKESITKSILIKTIEEQVPQSKANIEKVTINWIDSFKINIENLEVKNPESPIFHIKLTSVQLDRKGHVSIFINDAEVDIDKIQHALKSNSTSETKEKPTEQSNQFENIKKGLKLNLDARNIKLVSKINNTSTDVLINSITIQDASFNRSFDLVLDVSANISNGVNSAKLATKSTLNINLDQFIDENKIKSILESAIHFELNNTVYPKTTISLKSDISGLNALVGEATATSEWFKFSSKFNADLAKEYFQISQTKMNLRPTPLMKQIKIEASKDLSINDEAEIIILADGADLLKAPKLELSFHTENLNHVIIDAQTLPLKDIKGRLSADTKYITGEAEYGQTKLTNETHLNNYKPTKIHADGVLVVGDFEPILRILAPEFQISTKESRIEFKADVNFEEDRIIPVVDIKSSDTIVIENSEQYKLTLSNLSIKASQSENLISYATVVSSEISVPGQPTLFASFDGNGELKNKNEITARIDLNTWTSKNKSGTETTNAHLFFSSHKEIYEIEEFEGKFYFKDLAPFIPKDHRQKLTGLESSKAYLSLNGTASFAQNKITKSQLTSKLSSELQLKYDGNTIKVSDLALSLDPSNKAKLELKSQLTTNGSKDSLRLDLVSKSAINLNDILEKKKNSLQINNHLKINSKSYAINDLVIANSNISLSNINSRIYLSDFISFLPPSGQNSLKDINKSMVAVEIKGRAEINQKKISDIAIEAKTVQPISITLPHKIPSSFELKAIVNKNTMDFLGEVSTLNGKATLQGTSKTPRDFKTIDLKSIFPQIIKSKISDIRISKDLVREILYKPTGSVSTKVSSKQQEKLDFIFAKSLPPLKTILEPSYFFVENAKFSLQGDIDYKDRTFQSTNIKFTADDGSSLIKIKGAIDDNSIKMTLKSDLTKFNLNSFNAFLPPIVETITGDMSGNMTAVVTYFPHQQTQYKAEYNAIVKNGVVKNLNLTDNVKAIVSKLDFAKSYSEKIKVILTDKFEHLSIRGKATEKVLVLDDFDFIGIQNSVSLKGKGHIGQPLSKQQSVLHFTLADLTGKVSPLIKANTGLDRVPFKLTGTEIDLGPDIQYTLKEVGSGAVKVQVEKQGDKIIKSLEKKASAFLGDLLEGKKKKKKK